jgi:hypothetical protein
VKSNCESPAFMRVLPFSQFHSPVFDVLFLGI